MPEFEWLLTPEAAELLHCHPATLANWRYQRRGPPYERRLLHGHLRIAYRRDRLEQWAKRSGMLNGNNGAIPRRRATDL